MNDDPPLTPRFEPREIQKNLQKIDRCFLQTIRDIGSDEDIDEKKRLELYLHTVLWYVGDHKRETDKLRGKGFIINNDYDMIIGIH